MVTFWARIVTRYDFVVFYNCYFQTKPFCLLWCWDSITNANLATDLSVNVEIDSDIRLYHHHCYYHTIYNHSGNFVIVAHYKHFTLTTLLIITYRHWHYLIRYWSCCSFVARISIGRRLFRCWIMPRLLFIVMVGLNGSVAFCGAVNNAHLITHLNCPNGLITTHPITTHPTTIPHPLHTPHND